MPFSDPLADGPVIQRATERALAAGGSLRASLAMIEKVRPHISAPIVVFSYANPLLRMGIAEFARRAARRRRRRRPGARPADRRGRRVPRDARGVRTRYDLSAEPDDDRRADSEGGGARAAASCTASRAWASPARATSVASGAEALVRRIRAHTAMPMALGFGISRPEHVAEVGAYADAAVVGSALVSLIAEANGNRRELIESRGLRAVAEERHRREHTNAHA